MGGGVTCRHLETAAADDKLAVAVERELTLTQPNAVQIEEAALVAAS